MKRLRQGCVALTWVVLTLVVYLSNDVFLLVSGSDATSFVLGPPFLVQAAEVAAFGLCLLLPARAAIRAGLVVLAVATWLLAGQRLVIDGLHGEIRDVYFACRRSGLAFGPGVRGRPVEPGGRDRLSNQAGRRAPLDASGVASGGRVGSG